MQYFTKIRTIQGGLLAITALLCIGLSAPVAAQSDVVARFQPEGGNLTCETIGRSCVDLEISIEFKNEGNAASPARRVSLSRFNGTRATGYGQRFGGSGSFQQLPALNPGDKKVLTWKSNRVALGQQTYKPVFSPPLNEANRQANDNHKVTATYTVSGSGASSGGYSSSNRGGSSGGSSGSSSSSGPDVEATFDNNGTIPCDEPTTSNFCETLTVRITYTNKGQETSQQRRVSLNQFNGRRATGYAVRFGGSGAFETLPALAPGNSKTLEWTANQVQLGQYTFKPKYSPALNEGGGNKNRNHNVEQTLRVVGQ